jgi:ferritin-like metal-binding protein YciE
MQTAQEFFVHELNDMLDAERRILESLQKLEEESGRPELQKAFSQHRAQTEKQIQRLEQCFHQLDEPAEETECHGIKGLAEEEQAFMQEEPTEELTDLFHLGAAAKVEHYEIASYNALIDMAQKLEENKVVRFLQQNLREEQQMLKKCEGLLKKFKLSRLEEEAIEEEPEEQERPSQRRAA